MDFGSGAMLVFLLFVAGSRTGHTDEHQKYEVMRGVGYVGNNTYSPPLSCTKGRLISIRNIRSMSEHCSNEWGICPCSWQSCKRQKCTVKTSQAYTNHYNQILGCHGTNDCSTLTPPATRGSCFRSNDNSVLFVRIRGACVTGYHSDTTTSTVPPTKQPPPSTSEPRKPTTSSSDPHTEDTTRQLFVTTSDPHTREATTNESPIATSYAQATISATEKEFTANIAVSVAVPIIVVVLVSTGVAVLVVLLLRKRNKKHPKGRTSGAINNPVYTLPYDVKLPVPDLVPPDVPPAWTPSTVDDMGSIYNDPTAPYAVIQKPRTRSNPDELDVIENCVYANSRDSSLSIPRTVSEGWRSGNTGQQPYNEESPAVANRQGSGSETRDPDIEPSNPNMELKDIEVLENELYHQSTD